MTEYISNDTELVTIHHNPDDEEEDDEFELLEYECKKAELEAMERKIAAKKNKAIEAKQPNSGDIGIEEPATIIKGEEGVELNFNIEDGYDWINHMTELLMPNNNTNNKGDDKLQLPHDLFNPQTGTTLQNGRKYFMFSNNGSKVTDAVIENTVVIIEKLRKGFQNSIIKIIHKFWFDIANKLEMYRNGNRVVKDDRTLRLAIQQCQSYEDCKKI